MAKILITGSVIADQSCIKETQAFAEIAGPVAPNVVVFPTQAGTAKCSAKLILKHLH